MCIYLKIGHYINRVIMSFKVIFVAKIFELLFRCFLHIHHDYLLFYKKALPNDYLFYKDGIASKFVSMSTTSITIYLAL